MTNFPYLRIGVLLLVIFVSGCSSQFYAGRELPKAYLAELNWNIQQTQNGVFMSVTAIDGKETYLASKAYVKPGYHLIEYSCGSVAYTDPYPDKAMIKVEGNHRYGFVFNGFKMSAYPHPHPECDLDPVTSACLNQELIFVSYPSPCTFKIAKKKNPLPEFADPLPLNNVVSSQRDRLPWEFPTYCNANNPDICHFFGLPDH